MRLQPPRVNGDADAAAGRRYNPGMQHHGAAVENMAPDERGRALDVGGEEDRSDAVFDAVLHPNRSLPSAGFLAVMAIVIGANIIFGIYFFAIGAWPVIGFCGLDVFLVWLAFRISYRQGRLRERVIIRGGELRVSRILPSGHESRWRLQPFWTRVVIDRPDEHEAQVRVVSKGRSLVLGAFLSPDERMSFGRSLADALARAGRGD